MTSDLSWNNAGNSSKMENVLVAPCSRLHYGSMTVPVKDLRSLASTGIQSDFHFLKLPYGAILSIRLSGRGEDRCYLNASRTEYNRHPIKNISRQSPLLSLPSQQTKKQRTCAVYGVQTIRGANLRGRTCIWVGSSSELNRGGQERCWGRHQVFTRTSHDIRREGQGRHDMGLLVRAAYQDGGGAGLGLSNTYKMNLNEYMVTLDKPLGIRFAQTLDGKVYVEALAKQGNAENSRMIMVGDVLKKTSAVFGDAMWDVEDFSRTMHAIKNRNGSVSLVLERPVSPIHIQPLPLGGAEASFNLGRVATATWNGKFLTLDLQASEKDAQKEGNVGFAIFSSKFLRPKGLKALAQLRNRGKHENGVIENISKGYGAKDVGNADLSYEIISYFSDEESDGEVEWTHGSFSIEEYTSAVKRAEKDLCYNHSLGMQYTKITGDIFVGSCIQTETDVHDLAKNLGVSAVLNFQCKSEQINWGIDKEAIERSFREEGLVAVNCPIREVDSVDLRRKLPVAVGILYRLLRQDHRVFVTCTTGLDRSPTCVIAYLHWIRDVALQDAVDFVYSMHPCGPDRPALVWATWDLIAMAEKENHKGPPTHAVQFVWNHGCREGEEVLLVGDFKGEWNDPIKAVHASGPKYTVDLRLPQGKYYYKFIVGGQWRHSNSLPTEGDRWGNVNNVINIGDVATTKFDTRTRPIIKDLTSIKVIERPLTEDERFTLAFAARRMAFSICPIRLAPKR